LLIWLTKRTAVVPIVLSGCEQVAVVFLICCEAVEQGLDIEE
jgi:hypothetical protein